MGMMESAHTAVGFAGGLVITIFAAGVLLYLWAVRRD